RLVDTRERLDGQAEGEVVAALTAVLLGERQAEQAQLAHLAHDVEVEGVRAIGLVGLRRHHLLGEVAHHRGELALLLVQADAAEVVGHAVSCSLTRATGWSRRTWSPTATSRCTVPSCGASTGCSIFIASIETSGSPSRTVSPSATCTATTAPGMGARPSGSRGPEVLSCSASRRRMRSRRESGRSRVVAPSSKTHTAASSSAAVGTPCAYAAGASTTWSSSVRNTARG